MNSARAAHFSTLCAGFKGLRFLEELSGRGHFPRLVASYPVHGEDAGSLERIQALCKSRGAALEINSRPSLHADELTFVVGWQYLINATIPHLVIFHDSLLPRYRGFAPTVSALINGDDSIGVSAMLPTEEADSGPLIGQKRISLDYPVKIAAALSLQASAMAELAVEIIQKGTPVGEKAIAQDERQATYSLWRDEDDYRINWSQDSARIKRTVDALGFPYFGARTLYAGESVRIAEATEVEDLPFEIRQPGKIWRLDQGDPVVVCGKGLLRLDEVHDKMGKPISFDRLRMRFA